MVNTGRPSRDCESCRQRRVKCDLHRPTCRRCEKIGRACKYRNLDEMNVSFQICTPQSFNDRKAKRRQETNNSDKGVINLNRAGPTQTSSVSSVEDQEGHKRSSSPCAESQTIPSRIIEPWDMHIIPFIIEQFSFPSARGGRIHGSLECVPVLLQKFQPGSALHFATKAVGYVYLANRAPSQDSTLAQRKIYGNALKQLQLELDDPRLRNQDDVLMSVWLLCLYELMLGTPPGGTGPLNFGVHSRALTGLMRSRGKEQFKTRTGRQLFQLCYHYVQIQCFQSDSDPAPEASEWFDAMKSSADGDQYVFMPSFDLGNQAARICKNAKRLCGPFNSSAEKIAAIENAVQACKALEMLTQKVIEGLLAGYTISKATLLTTNRNQNMSVLRVANHHHTCLLRLYTVFLDLIRHAVTQPGTSNLEVIRLLELQQTCIEESQICINRILTALPRFLPIGQKLNLPTWADNLRLLWTLRGILCSPAASVTQMGMVKQGLRIIAYEGGIMQAVGSFPSNVTTYDNVTN